MVDLLILLLDFAYGLVAGVLGAWLIWLNSLGLVMYRLAVLNFSSLRNSVSGKYIFITGCDSGFGYGSAKILDAQNAIVFANCLTEQGAKKLAGECSRRLVPLVFDIKDEARVDEAFKTIEKALNGKPLYALVNNAGVQDGMFLEGTPIEVYRRMMEINFFALVNITKKFLPLLKRSPGTRIINIASAAGRSASADIGAYAATKYAVEAFSDSLRREIAHFRVQVCIIEPGFFKTPILMEGAKRMQKHYLTLPEQVKRDYPRAFDKAEALAANISENPVQVVHEIVLNCQAKQVILRSIVGQQTLWVIMPSAAAPTGFLDVGAVALQWIQNVMTRSE
jgi:11-cis-retinol dehydrogenase